MEKNNDDRLDEVSAGARGVGGTKIGRVMFGDEEITNYGYSKSEYEVNVCAENFDEGVNYIAPGNWWYSCKKANDGNKYWVATDHNDCTRILDMGRPRRHNE